MSDPIHVDIAKRLLREYGYPRAKQVALSERSAYPRDSHIYQIYSLVANEIPKLVEEGEEHETSS